MIFDDLTEDQREMLIKSYMDKLKGTVSKSASVHGLCAQCSEGKQKDINFLIEMSENLKEGGHRNDTVRLDHVQTMIDDWLDELTSA